MPRRPRCYGSGPPGCCTPWCGRRAGREIRCPGGPDARRGRVAERAHPWMRKGATEVATTQMGRLGAEDPVGISERTPLAAERTDRRAVGARRAPRLQGVIGLAQEVA